MNRLLLCLVMVCAFGNASARLKEGRPQLDSLLREEAKFRKNDSNKVRLLLAIASNYKYFKPDSGIDIARQALALAGELKWEQGFALSNNVIGQNYHVKADYQKALSYYQAAKSFNEKLNNQVELAKNLGNIGLIYSSMARYDSAQSFINQSIEVARKSGDRDVLAGNYKDMGILYGAMANNVKSLEYYFKSLGIYEEEKDSLKIEVTLANIGIIYKNQAEFKKALEVYSKALFIAQRVGDFNSVTATYSNIGTAYKELKVYDSAVYFYKLALESAEKVGAKNYFTINLCNLADVYSLTGRYDAAISLYDSAISLNRLYGYSKSEAFCLAGVGHCYQLEGFDSTFKGNRGAKFKLAQSKLLEAIGLFEKVHDVGSLKITHQYLSSVDSAMGDTKGELYHFRQAQMWDDSMVRMNNRLALARIEANHELELKDRDIVLEKLRKANNQKLYIIYIAGIVFLLVLLVWVVRKFAQQIKSNKHLSEEKEKHLEHIKAQSDVLTEIAFIQSHEIRGPVTTLMGLASLFNLEDPADPVNKELMEGVISVSERLDDVIIKVVDKENSLQKNHPSAGH